MTETVFVDTNVLVYSRDLTERTKRSAASGWLDFLWKTRRGRTSFQVLQEYYVAVTQKLDRPLPLHEARDDVTDLLAWNPVHTDGTVLAAAWHVQDRFGLSWWDALIVAAAETAGCRYLLTEDLQAAQDIGGLTVVDPFQTDWKELVGSE